MGDKTAATTTTIDRRVRRLVRDLTAIGLMEANDALSRDERLTAVLGPELHEVLRAELCRPLPLDCRPRRVA
jgi:hypothetical protein